jgi:hypothetical protein
MHCTTTNVRARSPFFWREEAARVLDDLVEGRTDTDGLGKLPRLDAVDRQRDVIDPHARTLRARVRPERPLSNRDADTVTVGDRHQLVELVHDGSPNPLSPTFPSVPALAATMRSNFDLHRALRSIVVVRRQNVHSRLR